MAEVVKKIVRAAGGMVKKLKEPWKITGPTAGAEYKEAIPDIKLYRKFSPATPGKEVSIPGSEADHVYNITYYKRDTRRIKPRTLLREIDPATFDAACRLPPSPPTVVLAPRVPLAAVPGDGYQK